MENVLKCHSGTTLEERLEWLHYHKGKTVQIHFEANMGYGWGDDMYWNAELTDDRNWEEAVKTMSENYIHGMKVVN